MNYKQNAAERLFAAIGDIDDDIVHESEIPLIKVQHGRFSIGRLAAIAAAVLLTFGFTFGIIGRFVGIFTESTPAVEAVLTKAATEGEAQLLSEAEMDFFDGKTHIIWSMDDSDKYYRITLTESDGKSLNNKAATWSDLTADVAESGFRLWIAYGDGKVVSPYLKSGNGNVGYGKLFDYSPEVQPSKEFEGFIKNLKG